MVIIRFQGGIGNQLFQYAFYKELEYKGEKVLADTSIFDNEDEPREYELDKLGLEVKRASKFRLSLFFPKNKHIRRLLFHFGGRKRIVHDTDSQNFYPEMLQVHNKYMIGYWQTEKYFEDVGNEIYDSVRFSNVNEDNLQLAEKMNNSESVSVHARFGDYVNHPLYEGICTEKYYHQSIEYIKRHVNNPTFYVISDDIDKAKNVFCNENCVYIDINHESNSYLDMYLISNCKHHIMAHSSFSWWGVFFSKKRGIVVAPNKWINDCNVRDVWREEWIRIGG